MLLGQGQTPVNRQKVTGKQKQQLIFFLQKSKKLLEHYAYETQRQVVTDMRGFVRYNEETGIRNILWGDLQESLRCKVKVVIDYV
mgnify:CR=1 FL=1